MARRLLAVGDSKIADVCRFQCTTVTARSKEYCCGVCDPWAERPRKIQPLALRPEALCRDPAHNAAEAEMASRRVHWLRHARSWAVAPAIVRRAEIGTALHHLSGNGEIRHAGVIALVALAAARIVGTVAA